MQFHEPIENIEICSLAGYHGYTFLVHFMYWPEFHLAQGKQYSTNTDFMRLNGMVHQMNYPLLVKFM